MSAVDRHANARSGPGFCVRAVGSVIWLGIPRRKKLDSIFYQVTFGKLLNICAKRFRILHLLRNYRQTTCDTTHLLMNSTHYM